MKKNMKTRGNAGRWRKTCANVQYLFFENRLRLFFPQGQLLILSDGFMYVWRGRQREAGLGPAGAGNVTLKEARAKAAEGRKLLRDGVDPLTEWRKPDAEDVPTFGQAADAYLDAQAKSLRNEKHAAQWRMTLTTYCAPIRKTVVDAIDTEAVLSILAVQSRHFLERTDCESLRLRSPGFADELIRG